MLGLCSAAERCPRHSARSAWRTPCWKNVQMNKPMNQSITLTILPNFCSTHAFSLKIESVFFITLKWEKLLLLSIRVMLLNVHWPLSPDEDSGSLAYLHQRRVEEWRAGGWLLPEALQSRMPRRDICSQMRIGPIFLAVWFLWVCFPEPSFSENLPATLCVVW